MYNVKKYKYIYNEDSESVVGELLCRWRYDLKIAYLVDPTFDVYVRLEHLEFNIQTENI